MRPYERFRGAKLLGRRRTLSDEVAANAVPIALIGAGVAWLAIRALAPREEDPTIGGHYSVYEGYDEDEGFRARMMARMGLAKARISGAFDQAREGLSSFAEGVREGRVGEMASAAGRQVDRTMHEDPLLVGFVGLMVGMALGAALKALGMAEPQTAAVSAEPASADAPLH